MTEILVMNMQILLSIFIILLFNNAYGFERNLSIEKLRETSNIKLPDQKELVISYGPKHLEDGNYQIRLYLKHKSVILWDKTFGVDYNELWYRASFIPLFENTFYFDLDNDGRLEIAVAIEHGGQAGWNSRALIFSVKDQSLVLLKKQNINIELSSSVYQRLSDYYEKDYKCKICY